MTTIERDVAANEDLYPSRNSRRAAFLPRVDPVVYTPEDEWDKAGIPVEQLRSYDEKGYMLLPGFFSPTEVAAWTDELNRLADDTAIKQRAEAIVEPASNDLRSLFAVHEISAIFRNAAQDARLQSIVQQILGSQAYIHQSRVNLKPGFVGKEFYWHSDFETWHVEDGMPRMRAVSCSILLTDNYVHNGPLMLVPGSHRKFISCVGETPDAHFQQSLKRQEFGVPDHPSMTALADEFGIDTPTGMAGSVLFFDCNTMHGSAGNISPYPRSNLFFVYNSVENRLVDPYCGLKPRPRYIATRD